MSNCQADKHDENLLDLFDLELKHSIECQASDLAFQSSVRIYINKPQVINKWLAGSGTFASQSPSSSTIEVLNKIPNKYHASIEYKEFIAKNSKIFQNVKYLIVYVEHERLFVFIPIDMHADNKLKFCSFCSVHALQYEPSKKTINMYLKTNLHSELVDHYEWFDKVLLKKVVHWSGTIKTCDLHSCSKLTTLTFYPNMINDYVELYADLKSKYWSQFSGKWFELTNTSPEKFIHEDISIATYLILIWRYLDIELKKFVDLGCGNGLLVYILNDLGYNGYGIDIQKRRVWDIYDLKDRLVERAVDPRTDTFEDCDWLIGNHSDELSPWLPIIANRSTTMNCNVFLIPCCFFDFNKKFDKKCDKKSRYDTYVDYLIKIFQLAGFFTYKDKLRMPSTKNICLVGIKSSISSAQDLEELDSMMNKESEVFQVRDLDKFMSKSMRNCTKNVDNKVKELIIQKVIGKMLTSDNCVYLTRYDTKVWNAGGVIRLDEVAALFDKDTLNKLKQECGGLKTLLKNHRQLFEIINKNSVRLRTDYNAKFYDDKNFDNFKKKRCLYDMMHPDGCFYENDKCTFLHQ